MASSDSTHRLHPSLAGDGGGKKGRKEMSSHNDSLYINGRFCAVILNNKSLTR